MKTLAGAAIHGTVWLTVGQYASSAVAILGNLWLARLLGPEPFGLYFVVSAFADVLFLLATFSFGQYVVQAPVLTRAHYRAVLLYSSGVAVALGCAAAAAAWAMRGQYPTSLLLTFLVIAIFRAGGIVGLTFTYALERAMNYRAAAATRFFGATVGLVLAIVVASRGAAMSALLVREAGAVLAWTLAAWLVARRLQIFAPDTTAASPYRDVWTFGCRLSGVQLLEQAFHRLDGILLARLLGLQHAADLGFYAQAKYLANIPNVATDAGARAVAYRVYAEVRDDRARLQNSLHVVQFWAVRAIVPVSLIFFALPEGALRWTMGSQWMAAAPPLRALSFFALFLVLFNNLKMYRLVTGNWKRLYQASGVQLVALVIGMAVGVRLYGVTGGAIAYACANAVGYGVIAWRCDALSDVRRSVRLIAPPLLAAAGAAILAWVVLDRSAPGERWFRDAAFVLLTYVVLWYGVEGRALGRSVRQIRRAVWA